MFHAQTTEAGNYGTGRTLSNGFLFFSALRKKMAVRARGWSQGSKGVFAQLLSCVQKPDRYFGALEICMNPELAKQALAKVGNPNVLVNIVSRRVRQLNAGGGGMGRPLVSDTGNLGLGDIALLEIIHDKVGFDMPEQNVLAEAKPKRKRRS
jgi:DNA-directed RNA polymerase subunit omega